MKNKYPPIVDLAVSAIEDVKGLDIKVLDVQSLTAITDHMVVCTGTSNRHVRSIAENVIVKAKERGHVPRGVEGLNSGEWVLVDLVGLVVHVMQAQARLFYQLEKLWDVPLPVIETKNTSKPKPKRKPKIQPKAKPKTKAKAQPKIKAQGTIKAKTQSKIKAKSKPKTKTRSTIKTKTKSTIKTKTKAKKRR